MNLLTFVEEWNYMIGRSAPYAGAIDPSYGQRIEATLRASMLDALGYHLDLDLDDFGRIIDTVDVINIKEQNAKALHWGFPEGAYNDITNNEKL